MAGNFEVFEILLIICYNLLQFWCNLWIFVRFHYKGSNLRDTLDGVHKIGVLNFLGKEGFKVLKHSSLVVLNVLKIFNPQNFRRIFHLFSTQDPEKKFPSSKLDKKSSHQKEKCKRMLVLPFHLQIFYLLPIPTAQQREVEK